MINHRETTTTMRMTTMRRTRRRLLVVGVVPGLDQMVLYGWVMRKAWL